MTKGERGRPRTKRGRRGAFAESFRNARRTLGVPQADAAADLGVDRTTIARWETGDTQPTGPALRFVLGWIERAMRAGGGDGEGTA